ncbi:hypothetical protein LXL04_014402 [Taraxacum kok-saghyz]
MSNKLVFRDQNKAAYRLLPVTAYMALTWHQLGPTWRLRGMEGGRIIHTRLEKEVIPLLSPNCDSSRMSSASSSFSPRSDKLDYQHPCLCNLPSRVKTAKTPHNYGKKFRVCLNSLSSRTPQCKFWEWLDDGAVDNAISGKISTEADNEISHWKMKLIQKNLSLKHEIEKIRLEMFYCKTVFFVIVFLYVLSLVLKG